MRCKYLETITISEFHCLTCDNVIYLPRRKGSQREEEHIKHLHCTHCNKIVDHREIREFDYVFDNNENAMQKIIDDTHSLLSNIIIKTARNEISKNEIKDKLLELRHKVEFMNQLYNEKEIVVETNRDYQFIHEYGREINKE